MKINGEWGSICGDRWTMRNTMVVCKQLGLGYAAGNYSTAHYGTTGKILMSGITCLGREASLDECLRHENVSCSQTKRIAAVKCQTSKYATAHSIYGSTSHCSHRFRGIHSTSQLPFTLCFNSIIGNASSVLHHNVIRTNNYGKLPLYTRFDPKW